MVYGRQRDHKKGEVLVKFLKWSLGNGQQFAMDLHYVPLPEELRIRALKLVDMIRY